jgi:signal transduction histidine kinase
MFLLFVVSFSSMGSFAKGFMPDLTFIREEVLNERLLCSGNAIHTSAYVGSILDNGFLEYESANYLQAMEYSLAALFLAENSGYKDIVCMASAQTALIYVTIGRNVDAIKYIKRAAVCKDVLNSHLIKNRFRVIEANINISLNYSDSLELIFIEAINYFEKKGIRDVFLCMAYINLGKIYSSKKLFAEAIGLFEKAIAIARIDSRIIVDAYHGIGEAYISTNNYTKSNYYLNKSKEVAYDNDDLVMLAKVYNTQGDFYYQNNDYKQACVYYKSADSLWVRLNELGITYNVQKLGLDYENLKLSRDLLVKKKESEINLLKTEKRVISLTLYIMVLILLMLASVLFYFYKRKIEQIKIIELNAQLVKMKKEQLDNYVQAQEEERDRFARDLHDSIGCMIAALKLKASAISAEGIISLEFIKSQAKEIVLITDDIYLNIREIAFNLMPRTLVKHGLPEALNELCYRLSINKKVEFQFSLYGAVERYSPQLEFSLFRIGQELASNIVKHSTASLVNVDLLVSATRVVLSISYNGLGFEPLVMEQSKGNGWRNVKTRLDQVSGFIEIDSSPSREGTTILVEVPFKKEIHYGKAV